MSSWKSAITGYRVTSKGAASPGSNPVQLWLDTAACQHVLDLTPDEARQMAAKLVEEADRASGRPGARVMA